MKYLIRIHLLIIINLCLSNYLHAEESALKTVQSNSKSKTISTATLSSDSGEYDTLNNVTKYLGNATYTGENISIKGDQMLFQKSKNILLNRLDIYGKPAQFILKIPEKQQSNHLTADHIQYFEKTQAANAQGNVHLIQTNEVTNRLEIRGSSFELSNPDAPKILITGVPLSLLIEKNGEPPIKAQARNFIYDQLAETLELSSEVVMQTKQDTINAEKIFYNMKTGNIQIPKTPGKQLEIITNKKKES